MRIEYFLKKPGKNKRSSFAVIARTTHTDGRKPTNKTITSDEISTINRQLIEGVQTAAYCELQLRAIIQKLKNPNAPRHINSPENMKVLERFWKDTYENRPLSDEKSGYNDYRRAIEALGTVSILTGTDKEIQKAIDSQYKHKAKKQRRIISKLQVILKYLGRSAIKLRLLPKPRVNEVRHLTPPELGKMLRHVPKEYHQIYLAAFYTGCRLGELFAVGPESFDGKVLKVTAQITPKLLRKTPKRDKHRKTFVPLKGRAVVRLWCKVPAETKLELYKHQHRRIITKACQKAFSMRPEKHCVFHDLRHSYAVYLLTNRCTLPWVAKNLGDTIQVAEEYYSGYQATESEFEAMESLMGEKKKKS